eukprot:scaffold303983_cov35-Prasinocladus_malaysianus.AAC.1
MPAAPPCDFSDFINKTALLNPGFPDVEWYPLDPRDRSKMAYQALMSACGDDLIKEVKNFMF